MLLARSHDLWASPPSKPSFAGRFAFCAAAAIATFFLHVPETRACTVGVCDGASTADGRPMIWHNLDFTTTRKYFFAKESGSPHDSMGLFLVTSSGDFKLDLHLNAAGFAWTGNTFLGAPDRIVTSSGARAHWNQNFDSLADIRTWLWDRATTSQADNIHAYMGQDNGSESVTIFERSDGFGPPNLWEYNPSNATRQANGFAPAHLYAIRSNNGFLNQDHCEPQSELPKWNGNSRYRYQNHSREIRNAIADDGRLSVKEVLDAIRWGDSGVTSSSGSVAQPLNNSSSWGAGWSVAFSVALGVKKTDDPKFATLLHTPGHVEYGVPVPCWVALKSGDLHSSITSMNTSEDSTWYWVMKYFREKINGTGDTSRDTYMRTVLDPVEDNILEVVQEARRRWFSGMNVNTTLYEQIKTIHKYAALASYKTIRSAAQTADANGKNCNRPPKIVSFGDSSSGDTLTLDPNISDDGAVKKYVIAWGDSTTDMGTNVGKRSHTYAGTGQRSYLVMLYVEDDDPTYVAANVKWKYITIAGSGCGNKRIDPGETCDPPGTCPTDCDDGVACTQDTLIGSAANCDAACSHTAITECKGTDGCCPAGCTNQTDKDCSTTCGNETIEVPETCDPPASCPADCDDQDACTRDLLTGSAANCSAACSHVPITACRSGDGCCPTGCDRAVDDDCGTSGPVDAGSADSSAEAPLHNTTLTGACNLSADLDGESHHLLLVLLILFFWCLPRGLLVRPRAER